MSYKYSIYVYINTRYFSRPGSPLWLCLPDVQPHREQAFWGARHSDNRRRSAYWAGVPDRRPSLCTHRNERDAHEAVHRVRGRQAAGGAGMWEGKACLEYLWEIWVVDIHSDYFPWMFIFYYSIKFELYSL